MGLKVNTSEQYKASLQKLFPQGSYWEKQFADADSDCSFFCRAKTDELTRFRCRMADLYNESVIQTAEETLDDWERIILNTNNSGLTLEQRRTLLILSKTGNITLSDIKQIGLVYGLKITEITFPFKPAFFGFSSFGINPIASPAAFSVIYIHIVQTKRSESFEKEILTILLGNYIVFFKYGGA